MTTYLAGKVDWNKDEPEKLQQQDSLKSQSSNIKSHKKIAHKNEIQMSSYLSKIVLILTLNSQAPGEIPMAAPVPANPIKCSLPILLTNKEAPTCNWCQKVFYSLDI